MAWHRPEWTESQKSTPGDAPPPAMGDAPGNDDFIADILVNLAALVCHRIGDQGEHPIEEAMHATWPNLLGNAGRSDDIHKKKKSK